MSTQERTKPPASSLDRIIRANSSVLSWKEIFFYGLQQVLVCVSPLLTVPLTLSYGFEASEEETIIIRNELISSTFLVSGLSTIIQTLLGVRLPLLQGAAFAFVPPALVFLKEHYQESLNIPWQEKMATLQGSLAIASALPILAGMSGLVGWFTQNIGPLTIAPLMLLLATSQINNIARLLGSHWIGWIEVLLLIIAILYLPEYKIPFLWRKNGKFEIIRYSLIGDYPFLIVLSLSYIICVLLNIFGFISQDSSIMMSSNETFHVIAQAPYFKIPFPGAFGRLTFSTNLVLAFCLSALTSMFESVGDYHGIAHVSDEASPGTHVINRGILAEGLGTLLSGLLGPAIGMTTHTENIGVIGITKVAARSVMIMAGLILIFLGTCTKIGALLATIPEPLIGGVLACSMITVVSIAGQNIRKVDFSIPRNNTTFGTAIIFGFLFPSYFKANPADTGFKSLDEFIDSFFQLGMFVGALTALILDSTVPGATREERGFSNVEEEGTAEQQEIYNLPIFFMDLLKKVPCLSRLPFLPRVYKTVDILEDMHPGAKALGEETAV